jgi:hypothetical protein
MRPYTQLGNGDFDPPEPIEVETCLQCGKPAIEEYDGELCSFSCWHLYVGLGRIKRLILIWQSKGLDAINLLSTGGWFENMTPSTAERYRRAVKNLIEDAKIIKQADEYRDQDVWQGGSW